MRAIIDSAGWAARKLQLTDAVVCLACSFLLMNVAQAQAEPPKVLDTAAFERIDWGAVRQRASNAERPRTLHGTTEWRDIREALLRGERAPAYDLLLKRVKGRLGKIVEPETAAGNLNSLSGTERALRSLEVKKSVTPAAMAAQESAFAALMDPAGPSLADAKAKMLALARLDTRGASGAFQEDLSARFVTWTLAMGLDWLPTTWTVEEKSLIIRAISVRMDDFAAKLVHGPRALRKDSLDSHANEVLGAC